VTAREPETPESDEDLIVVETDQQLHAIGNLMRHRVLRVLRDGPATVTQIAARLGIAKGSSNYHVKVLAKAGFIDVVESRKVRGVTELYYGMSGRAIVLPKSGPGEPELLMRHALADVEAAPPGAPKDLSLKHLRLSETDFAVAVAKLHTLHAELTALNDPTQPAADFFYAIYRPQDTRQNAEDPPGRDAVGDPDRKTTPEPDTEPGS
jgi:DNA-binding transcriptional ArsR family regulator